MAEDGEEEDSRTWEERSSVCEARSAAWVAWALSIRERAADSEMRESEKTTSN